MEIIVADKHGFCGGVKRAVKMAFDNADEESTPMVILFTTKEL